MTETEKMIDISVVIPVYNCEKYIKHCINSVQMQTLKNLEIICVDDGSTDLSYDILRELAICDERIKVFEQKNSGAGEARNLGIEKARGMYIAFLDSDDYYMDERALQTLLQYCVQLKVKACGGVMCHNINGIEKRASNYTQLQQISRQNVRSFFDYPLDYDFTTFIFERSVITDNKICFSNYSFYEDPPFLVKVLFYAQKYAVADIEFYCYRIKRERGRFTYQNCRGLLLGLKENLEFSILNNVEKLFARTLSRLEYEYGERILASLQTDKVDGLQLLIEVNEVVKRQSGYEGYTIGPLKKILSLIAFMQNNYELKLRDNIKGYERFYIFGAGTIAQKFLSYLKGIGAYEKVEGLLVTDKGEMQNSLKGIPVYNIAEFKKCLSKSRIYIAVKGLFVAEIVQVLNEMEIEDYEILNTELLNIC